MKALFLWIASLGGAVRLAVGKLISLLLLVVKTPILWLFRGGRALLRFASSSFRRVVGDEKFFTGRVVRAVRGVLAAGRKNPKSVPSTIRYYARRSLARYGGLARYLLLLSAPAAAALLFAFTISHYAALTPALCLTSGERVLGYVTEERSYFIARNRAVSRLQIGRGAEDNVSSLLPEVTAAPALVPVNRLTGEEALCEALLSLSDAPLTDACGVYIDGDFLCALKSESEARAVFKEVLQSLAGSAGGVISFAEDVRFVQGVYPDDPSVIFPPDRLKARLTEKGEGVYDTVAAEGTPAQTAAAFGLTEEALLALNPALAEQETVPAGTKVLLAAPKSFLSVKSLTTEVIRRTQAYETVEIPTDTLYIGTSRVVVQGVDGAEQITNLVTYIDGARVAEQELSRVTLASSVPQTMQIGTRALDSTFAMSSNLGGILLWPAVGTDRINSDYGYRWGSLHSALDIGSSEGTSLGKTVIAAAEGTVVISGVHSSYGYYVKIDHGNGMQTLYGHCLENSLLVQVGDHVLAGQPIARVGMTGYATGPHLHFEVWIDGVRVDPKPYLGIA